MMMGRNNRVLILFWNHTSCQSTVFISFPNLTLLSSLPHPSSYSSFPFSSHNLTCTHTHSLSHTHTHTHTHTLIPILIHTHTHTHTHTLILILIHTHTHTCIHTHTQSYSHMHTHTHTHTAPVVSTGSNTWENRRLGCVGVPLDNVIVKILDPETLEEKPHGTDGEVVCVHVLLLSAFFIFYFLIYLLIYLSIYLFIYLFIYFLTSSFFYNVLDLCVRRQYHDRIP